MAGDLKLEYSATLSAWDALSRTAWRKTFVAVSKTLATETVGGVLRRVYLHGNSDVAVMRDTANVSKHYAIRRKWRNWQRPLDPNDREVTLGGYLIDTSTPSIDSGDKPLGEWFDGPGTMLYGRQTKFERLLIEWVIGGVTSYHTLVEGLAGLYFFIVLDLTPTAYRLAMSPSFPVSVDDTVDVLGGLGNLGPLPATGPYKTEVDIPSGGWLDRQTAWQDYATINNRLPVVVTP